MKKRVIGIDILRGIAIVLMVIFHFSYDLNYFKFAHIPLYSNPFWLNFRLLIVNIFLITSGMSLALAYQNGINLKKFLKRVALLASISLLITIVTYFIFPKTWVYFGVIHFILVATIVGVLFINRAVISLILAISILIGYFYLNFNMHPIFYKVAPILHLPMRHTEDLVPFIPWFSATLIGVSIIGFKLHSILFENRIFLSKSRVHNLLSFVGKHSLLIYLIHQPIIFALMFLASKV